MTLADVSMQAFALLTGARVVAYPAAYLRRPRPKARVPTLRHTRRGGSKHLAPSDIVSVLKLESFLELV